VQKTWLCAAEVQLGLAHRTVRWCTGQCPLRQAGPSEKASLGTRRRRMAIIHRTVRWVVRGELIALRKQKRRRGYNSPDCPVVHRTVRWANGRQRAPDYPVCTRQCPVRQRAWSCNGHLCQKRKEIGTGQATVAVRWRTGLSGAPLDRRQG
jgi:hypothetical protein